MAGTLEGGRKAAKVIAERYGPDYRKKIGSKGGKLGGGKGGFTTDRELARRAGRIGGSRSKKGIIKKGEPDGI